MATTTPAPVNVERILAKRSQRTREKFLHLDAHQDQPPPPDLILRGILQDIDEATMSASFVISTQDVDRSGEVVDTAGIKTESHRLNPVVLWDHGRGPIGKLPIGKCEDRSGNYSLVVRAHEGIAIARIFFSRTLPFASDVFKLCQEGCIRGASIGFRSVVADPMPGYEHASEDDDPPLHYKDVELCELSLTAVPDNPRSLAIKVNKAFEGRRLSKEMATVVKGWDTETKSKDSSGHEHAADGKFGSSASESNDKATRASASGKHAEAAGRHKQAAESHASAAKAATASGNHESAAAHKEASEAHQAAADEHGRAAGGNVRRSSDGPGTSAHDDSLEADHYTWMAERADGKAKQVGDKSKGKSMAPKKLGRSFVTDVKSLNESGIAVLSKALASITGKAADEYLKMDDDGKLKDDDADGKKSEGMSTTSGADGDFLDDDAVKKADDDAPLPVDAPPADDVPSYKQPLDGPPSQAAAADLHTQLASVGEAIQGWAARQENEEFKALAAEAADTLNQLMAKMADFHDNTHPDADPLGATPAESEADDEPPEGEEEEEVTKSARLKLKAAPHQRLEKRLKIFRAKSAKAGSKIIAKKLSKSEAAAIAKAASFLAKVEADVKLDETLQAAGGFHAKSLAQIAKGIVADDDGLDTKALKAQVEKAQTEAAEYRKVAEKAVQAAEAAKEDAKAADAKARKIVGLWKEHREKNWQSFR